MNELIERKNKMLRDVYKRMVEAANIANLLKEGADLSDDAKRTLMVIASEKLSNLTSIWTDAYLESNISEPEANEYED